MTKNLILDLGPNLGRKKKKFFFFFKNLASSVTRYNGQISSCTISDKTNDPILRKLRDGRTDGRKDGRTDGQTARVTSWTLSDQSLASNKNICLSSY